MIIGYARVSTTDQNLDRQLDALKKARCERIYQEKFTGTKADRPEFSAMMRDGLRSGDTLVVESFTRLSRSTKDLLAIVEELKARKIHLVSLKEDLDTTTATGQMMLTFLAGLAQFERDLTSERTKEALKSARIRGRQGGRPSKGTAKEKSQAMALYNANAATNTEIAQRFGISKSTLAKWIREYKAEQRRQAESQGSSSGG